MENRYLKTSGNNAVGWHLDMNDHRIIGLKDPIKLGDAVNRRYVSSRIRALNDEREALKGEVEERINRIEKILSYNNRIMILRWELRNHNPLIFGQSRTLPDNIVDNLDDYFKQIRK